MDYLAAMRAFVRSADLGSFSQAAAEQGAKISTVSRQVSRLEADLGVALFNRSTRRLHLTEAGLAFYERARQILIDVEDSRSLAASFNSFPRGLLRINIPSAFGRRHVMPHMKDFLAAYPDISLDATLTDTTVDLIQTGADVAIRIGALSDSTLVVRKLAPHRRVLVASADYLAVHPTLNEPEQLADHECLHFALEPTDAWYFRQLRKPAVEPSAVVVHGHLRANDSETLREAALSGQGIALLPTWLVGQDVTEGRLLALLTGYECLIALGAERAVWAVYPPKKVVSPKVKAFIAFLSERYGKPPYWDDR
jgi:DNA-binding transcriptional LysR family regulator